MRFLPSRRPSDAWWPKPAWCSEEDWWWWWWLWWWWWWTKGPSDSVESLLFITTLMRLMDSAGLPDGGPRGEGPEEEPPAGPPLGSAFRLRELVRTVGPQFSPMLWTPLCVAAEESAGEPWWWVLPELPGALPQFFLKEAEVAEEEELAFDEGESEAGPWDEARKELFFLFFPELKLALLLVLLIPAAPPKELGVTGVEEEPDELSRGLKDAALPAPPPPEEEEERDLNARTETGGGARGEEEWAEGICGDEDTCRACVAP